ncbi:Suppressor of Profilin deletion [Recurvomyces mirabilis]|uniref:Suppressor of Profilin deletion n=1 Tax=Recurvomyces mirabilis TaxID=574656 RepID=A0AAE0TTV7_9PEZI|nr:Suppressor of Profilin deletion [Recurvomyces mirabilis]
MSNMERQDYPAMLPQLQPGQAVDILNDRVRQVGRLNTAIADWLQERRKLEEQYSTGLRRLARKQIEDVDLGIFSIPWTTLTEAATTTADAHSSLAAKIEVDVEQPLREFVSTNREMQAMSTIQGNLASMAKDITRAKDKADKLQGRGERAESGKIANASSELDHAESQWQSQAPYVFENLQAVDEARINRLRDVLTQFQTHEVDLVQKNQTTAEHCLNVLLSLQTEDEIRTFALRSVQGKPRPASRAPRPSVPTTPSASRAPTGNSNTLAPTLSQSDNISQRSGSVQEDKKKSRFGGALKRLGTTVGGRKRESRMPPGLAPMAESPEKKSKSPFNSIGGRFGKQKHQNLDDIETSVDTPSRERPRPPLRMGSEMFESSSAAQPTSPNAARGLESSHVNGGTAAALSALEGAPRLPPIMANGGHQGDLADLEPPKPTQPEPVPMAETQRDAEGYSLPPQTLDPISQAQADAAAAGEGSSPAFNVNIRNAPIQDESTDSHAALTSMASTLSPPPFVASKVGTVRGRRNRPVSTIAGGAPMTESPAAQPSPSILPPTTFAPPSAPPPSAAPVQAEQARDAFPSPPQAPAAHQSSLPSIPQSPGAAIGVVGAVGAAGAAAGVAAGGFSPFSSTTNQPLPFRPESAAGDTGSIRSGRSLTSTSSQVMKHPELTETGLNSSVVETVSARFENGKLTSSSLIGEIALAYNPANFNSPFGSETIRLENFASLEKVAPNPAFISPTATGKEGEYTLNLSSLAKTQVAFKYQIQSEASAAHTPLLVTPAFKIEPTQASIIVAYNLHPDFHLHGRTSLTLSNVVLALTLDGAKASGCQSKPMGSFSRERNLIYWQLGDVTVSAGSAPQKLLARFTTDSEAVGGSVEARWEIGGEEVMMLGSGLAVSVSGQPSGAADGSDPFADEEGAAAGGLTAVWRGVRGVKKLASGAYTAK